MSNAPHNAPDAQSIGRFKLINCLATGNHSQVWEVVDPDSQRRVALKALLPEALAETDHVSAMKNEFKAGKAFEHPNIIKYYESTINRKNAYFTMELFPAPNLKTQLFNSLRGVQVRLKRIVELVAMALEHVHERGWVHRDIKPDNILVNKSAEVRLIDFSLAIRQAGALSKMFTMKSKTTKGTRTYMAPEQIMGKPLTNQTDIYALGVTIFEMLTGQPPFSGSTPKDLLLKHMNEPAPAPSFFNQNITEEMDRIVLRMLSKKPANRQKNLSEFMAEFRNVNPFKEEVTEERKLTEQEQAELELKATLGERLDSRTDALRTRFGVAAPAKPQKARPQLLSKKPLPPPATPPRGPASAPPSPMPGYAMPPMYPQPVAMQPMPMPQMPMPGAVPVPQGPVPWVAAPGMPAGPWVAQPPAQPAAPPAGKTAPPAAFPPAGPLAAPRPMAPPVVPPGPPAAPSEAQPQPVVPPTRKPAPPMPAKPAASKPAAPAAGAAKPKEEQGGFHIGELEGFEDLPTA